MAVLVDTDHVDPADREDALRQAITRASGPHDVHFVGREPDPGARLEYWRFNRDVVAMEEFSTGIGHLRDERHDRITAPENVAFVVHDGPPGRYSSDDHGDVLCAGGLYATDLSGHFMYRRTGRGEVRIVQIERSALGLTVEHLRAAANNIGRSPLYALFRAQLVESVSAAESIAATSAAKQVAESLIGLAAALLRTTAGAEARTSDFLCERIELFLRDNFRRRDLSPAFIAYAHHISERYLFTVWMPRPRSLMETVYELRLDHARRMLAANPHSAVAAVAAESGFQDASHFSRRFRAAFGLSPSEFRHLVRPGAGTVR